MTEPSLPDDPAQWPADPFQLLGVPHDVSARDLKRAYTQLIRRFKPEQRPEEFRRVRQAYEMVQQFAEWKAMGIFPAPAGPAADLATDADEDRHWRQAVESDSLAGYAALRECAFANPSRVDLPLRLYWLRKLFPEVDPSRTPIDWLRIALRQPGHNVGARELLIRELYDRPAESLQATGEFLDADWPVEALGELASARWLAALRTSDLGVVSRDLDRLQTRIKPTDDRAWLCLQFAAIDVVAWRADEPAAAELQARCHDEVRRLEHRAVNEGHLFDRLDYLFLLASSWRTFRRKFQVPPCLLELIPVSWSAPAPRYQPLVERVLHEVVSEPRVWLNRMDELMLHAPVVLDCLGQVFQQALDRLETPPVEPYTPTELARLAADCVSRTKWRQYASLRPEILQFCLDEFVTVEMFAAVAPPMKVDPNSAPAGNLHDSLIRDWPLRMVCWANRLFWA